MYVPNSDPLLKNLSDSKVSEWRLWFDNRLDNAIEAASTQQHPEIESKHSQIVYHSILSQLITLAAW